MGLEAAVYCDCFERGDLEVQPRPEWEVYVAENGSRETTATDLDLQTAFDSWDCQACCHDGGVLLDHYIGNIGLVGRFRELIGEHPNDFPLILEKVIYSGSHCGDYLVVGEVEALQAEVERIAHVHSQDAEAEQWLRGFEAQMLELVGCALRVKRPIAF